MPTYDYECDACGHKFEEFQNISAEPLVKCPNCGKKKLRRLFGAGAGILFKGSGFYQTDYRSDSYKKRAASDSTSSTSSGGGESKSSDSKGTGSTPSSGSASQSKSSGGGSTGSSSGAK